MKPRLTAVIEIGKTYVQVAELTAKSKRCGRDGEAQTMLERMAADRLRLARSDVKRMGKNADQMWAQVDLNARMGHLDMARGYAKDVVDGVRAHVS